MNQTFEEWMAQVDALFTKRFGLGASDFADAPWRDFFDDELSPSEAFSVALVEWS